MKAKKEGWVNCLLSSKESSKEHGMHIFRGQKEDNLQKKTKGE